MSGKKSTVAIALISFVSLLFGAIGGAGMSWLIFSNVEMQGVGDTTVINFENISYTEAVEAAAPAVVSVVALKDLSEFYNQFSVRGFGPSIPVGGGLQEVSSGTAFIITADGMAVTNKHVVEDTEAEYVVVLSDGTELDAEVLGRDSLNDIALIQIVGDDDRIGNLPTLEFADSDNIQVGTPVLAIGNALGEYSNSVTAGIISAIGRSITASTGYGGGTETLVDLFQTDAAINSGNSGGPLIDLSGNVVGMNTAIDSTAEGIGFAITADDIAVVVASYKEFGEIVRPFIGVRYIMVTEGIKKRFSLDVDYGAYLIGDLRAGTSAIVEGSPAEEAGLQEGDIILSVNGQDLTPDYTLSSAIAGYFVGEKVVFEVLRGTETLELEVVLEAAE